MQLSNCLFWIGALISPKDFFFFGRATKVWPKRPTRGSRPRPRRLVRHGSRDCLCRHVAPSSLFGHGPLDCLLRHDLPSSLCHPGPLDCHGPLVSTICHERVPLHPGDSWGDSRALGRAFREGRGLSKCQSCVPMSCVLLTMCLPHDLFSLSFLIVPWFQVCLIHFLVFSQLLSPVFSCV